MIRIILILFLPYLLLADSVVSREELKESYSLAEEWFLKSLNQKGIFDYSYDPISNQYSASNNAIRQLMASRLLAEMSAADPGLQEKHRKNLNFIFTHWVKEKQDLKFIYMYRKSKLGANAMLLRTLVASPFFNEYQKVARQVKDGILHTVNPVNGEMNPFLIDPDYDYDRNYLLTFYTGEALLALIEYYEKVADLAEKAELMKRIKQSQDYYLSVYVDKIDNKLIYYPAYVPWHSMSLNKLYKLTGEEKYARAIFILNNKLLELQDRSNHVGRFFNPEFPQYGTPHASADGVYTEGLAYALEIARILKDEYHTKVYEEAILIGFKNLISLQYSKDNSQHLADPDKVIGAYRIFRTKPDAPFSEPKGSGVRIDSVQHTLDAFRKYFALNNWNY